MYPGVDKLYHKYDAGACNKLLFSAPYHFRQLPNGH